MSDTDELRAICLVIAISKGGVRERLYKDYHLAYSGEDWNYIAQNASKILIEVMVSIFASYAYAALTKPKKKMSVNDLFTREVAGGIVKYRKAVDRLRDHRVQKPGSQEHVDVRVKWTPMFGQI
jgi:hypothetical protein